MDTSWDPMTTSAASAVNNTSGSGRTIVICFDGTTNCFCDTNTNVVQLFTLLNVNEPDKQICYYQPGVGTYFKPGVVSPFFQGIAKALDFMFAWYLDDHVMQGYQFLINNYKPNDVICVFGFSRGAYTARALAGLVAKIGILPRDNEEQVSFAYKLYKQTDAQGVRLAAGFKKTFSVNPTVKIDFLGVWDTVASVGLAGKSLPFTNTNTDIKIFRHALSLDEHRASFRPNLYHFTSPNPYRDPQKGSNTNANVPIGSSGPDVREVWFAGCHNDIGAGLVENTAPYALGYISLKWMVQEVKASGLPVLFDDSPVAGKSTDTDAPAQELIDPKESIHAVQVMHDPLVEPFYWIFWWMLEFLFLNYYWQDSNFRWHDSRFPNLGRGRLIPTANPLFHVSVATRIGDRKLGYRPRARYIPGSETYVR